MRSCARRSRDAATIFIAFVICCVDLTARTRRRISRSEGIFFAVALIASELPASSFSVPILWLGAGNCLRRRRFSPRGERIAELFQRLRQIRFDLIVDLFFLGQRCEELRASCIEELEERQLVRARLVHLDAVEESV